VSSTANLERRGEKRAVASPLGWGDVGNEVDHTGGPCVANFNGHHMDYLARSGRFWGDRQGQIFVRIIDMTHSRSL
jgi:hypothetical protein